MYCPALEYEITQNKKRAERAREMSRTGYCYFVVQDKNNLFYITSIINLSLREYQAQKLQISKSKKYKTVNGFWSDIKNVTNEQYNNNVEIDNPVLNDNVII